MKRLFLLFTAVLFFYTSQTLPQSSISFIKKGKGRPVIFLPGLGCKGSVWDSAVNKLSAGYCCYEISYAGFAGMPPDGTFKIDRIIKDIIKFINQQKLQHPVLIGHSLSGFIALKAAAENPDVFSKLIIVDSFPFALAVYSPAITVEKAKQQGKIYEDMILKQNDEEFKKSERAMLSGLISGEKDIDTVLNWMMLSDRNAIAAATYEMISTDLRPELKKIKCSALIIGTWKGKEQLGFNKVTTPKIFAAQYENLKNKSIAVSDDSKHFIMLDAPEWLNSQITRFLSE